jgi:hypothetical protein
VLDRFFADIEPARDFLVAVRGGDHARDGAFRGDGFEEAEPRGIRRIDE